MTAPGATPASIGDPAATASALGPPDAPAAPPRLQALAAGLVSELRSPLSRVELAASQLRRELRTPRARELAATISQAVDQADREIERILALLAPLAATAPRSDVRPVLARLRARVAPALDARGTACEVREPGPDPLRGDPLLVEQAALALARIASGLVGPGGRLSLALAREGDRMGVVVDCTPAEGGALRADPHEAFAGLAPWAARHGGELAHAAPGSSSAWSVALWLPGGVT